MARNPQFAPGYTLEVRISPSVGATPVLTEIPLSTEREGRDALYEAYAALRMDSEEFLNFELKLLRHTPKGPVIVLQTVPEWNAKRL